MKQGEIDYMKKIGEDSARGAYDKPFSHFTCSKNLVDMGLIMSLLPQPPARLLDLGCGTGWTSAFFARRGYRVVGQDIAPDMIDYARQNKTRYEAAELEFIVSDYESLAFDDPFDCAVFYDSLHHAVDERAALQSVYRALRPDGILVTHEPGVGHSMNPDSIAGDAVVRCHRKGYAAVSHSRSVHVDWVFAVSSSLLDPTEAVLAMYGNLTWCNSVVTVFPGGGVRFALVV